MVQEELIEVLIDSEEVLQLPSSIRCQKVFGKNILYINHTALIVKMGQSQEIKIS